MGVILLNRATLKLYFSCGQVRDSVTIAEGLEYM